MSSTLLLRDTLASLGWLMGKRGEMITKRRESTRCASFRAFNIHFLVLLHHGMANNLKGASHMCSAKRHVAVSILYYPTRFRWFPLISIIKFLR